MERLENGFSHEWHVAINQYDGDYEKEKRFMYRGKETADEVPRMMMLFQREREGKLPQVHKQCSHSHTEPVVDNHLTCCLGKACRECPMLLSLDKAKLTPEQIDQAKAWTCAAHILGSGGDPAGEGFILTIDDIMYWQRVYENMAQPPNQE